METGDDSDLADEEITNIPQDISVKHQTRKTTLHSIEEILPDNDTPEVIGHDNEATNIFLNVSQDIDDDDDHDQHNQTFD